MDDGDCARRYSEVFLKTALQNRRNEAGDGGRTYRFCVDCDEPIPESRRQAVPGCKRCTGCQQKTERNA